MQTCAKRIVLFLLSADSCWSSWGATSATMFATQVEASIKSKDKRKLDQDNVKKGIYTVC